MDDDRFIADLNEVWLGPGFDMYLHQDGLLSGRKRPHRHWELHGAPCPFECEIVAHIIGKRF